MRLSYSWLSELIEELPPVERLADRLTFAGLEVEGIFRQGEGLAEVRVGRVLAKEKVAGSDKLNVCQVDVGTGAPLTIVCGAANYEVGALVPAALPGTVLPGGQRIERTRIRGVESAGMLCSARELGLSEDASGLLLLDAGARPGALLTETLGLTDVALELNVTPNRPDWLSHLGVAREVSALTGAPLKQLPGAPRESGAGARERVAVAIEAPERCPRYAARVVEGVRFGPSPRWMQQRLELCGVRSLGNLVDVTNYVMLELGEPLHAFDLDQVRGPRIVVRRAMKGEHLLTLDGKDRALDTDDLVIADAERALVLAGIFGGAEAEVGPRTSRVLLEAATFTGSGIRRSARRHGLHTESSHRFERGADPTIVPRALDRAAALLEELAGGETRRGAVDLYPGRREPGRVRLRYGRVSALLGAPVPAGESRKVLVSLGLAALEEGAEAAVFEIPGGRGDLTREADLIEEIARVRGYESIPSVSPAAAAGVPADEPRLQVIARLQPVLAAAGLNESLHMAFADPRDLRAVGSPPALSLVNPLGETASALRTTLVPGLLRTLVRNRSRQVEDVRLYEIAHTFLAEPGRDQPVQEPERLAGVLAGARRSPGWSEAAQQVDFFDVKGVVEAVLAAAGIEDATYGPVDSPLLHPTSACAVRAGDVELGTLGELHPDVATYFELPRGVFVFDLSLDAIVAGARLAPRPAPVPRFPAVKRDLAVVVPAALPAAELLAALRRAGGMDLVESVDLFDVYQGPQVPEGQKSLALAIRYRAADRTLTDEEVEKLHGALVQAARALGGELRA